MACEIMLTPTNPTTPGAFRFWLLRAKPGEEFVYHAGFLMIDREFPAVTGSYRDENPIERLKAVAERLGLPDPEFEMRRIATVNDMADAAWQAQRLGDVVLFQRRLGPGYFAYVAKKTTNIQHAWKEAV